MVAFAVRKIDSADTGMQDFYRFNAWHLRNAIDKERIENPNILVWKMNFTANLYESKGPYNQKVPRKNSQ